MKSLSLAAALSLAATTASALTVQQNNNASALVSSILGQGVTVVGTPTLSGAPSQFGTFGNGNASVGFDSGIVLSTGNVSAIPGPNGNTDLPETTGFGDPSGDDLSINLGGPGSPKIPNSFDAASLAFDFQFGDGSVGGQVNFGYVFASEEYVDFVGSIFNDEFQLLIDGVNVGTIGGQKVNVNNVNATNNPGQYINNVDNTDNILDAALDLSFDGLTTALIAASGPLGPGIHTAEFIVADVSDGILDAGVFIQAGSFNPDIPTTPGTPGTPPSSPPTTVVPLPAGMPLLLLGLGAIALVRRRRT